MDLAQRIEKAVAGIASDESALVQARLHLAAHIAAAVSDAGLPGSAAVAAGAEIGEGTERQIRDALGADASQRLVAEAMTKGASLIAKIAAEQVVRAAQEVGR